VVDCMFCKFSVLLVLLVKYHYLVPLTSTHTNFSNYFSSHFHFFNRFTHTWYMIHTVLYTAVYIFYLLVLNWFLFLFAQLQTIQWRCDLLCMEHRQWRTSGSCFCGKSVRWITYKISRCKRTCINV
jgi:hypothetical protein